MTAQDIEDIVEVDDYYDQARIRPLQGGCYTDRLENFAFGTLGCAVTYTGPDGGPKGNNDKLKYGHTYALSAEHVIGEIGTLVNQPGDVAGNRIGTVQLAVSFRDDRYGDFAICDLDELDDKFLPQILELGAVLGEHDVSRFGDWGCRVSKRGSQTGVTHGTLSGIDVDATIADHGEQYRLKDLLAFTSSEGPFCGQGDSGSVVVNSQNQVLGLLVAANEDFTIGYAVPISRIREKLQVKVRAAEMHFSGAPTRRVPAGKKIFRLLLELPAPAPHDTLMINLTTDRPDILSVPAQTFFPKDGLKSVAIPIERLSDEANTVVVKAAGTHVPDLIAKITLYLE